MEITKTDRNSAGNDWKILENDFKNVTQIPCAVYFSTRLFVNKRYRTSMSQMYIHVNFFRKLHK